MNKMTRYGIVMLAFSFAVGEANAQFGLLAERGVGVNFGYATQDDITQFGAGAGYVVNPLFEVGIGASRSLDDELKINATGVGPFVGFYPVRMSPKLPVSVRLGAGYNRLFFAGDAVDGLSALGVDMSGSTLLASGGLFLGLPLGPSLYIVPLAEAGYMRTSIKMDSSSGSNTDDDNSKYVTVGGSLIVAVSPASRLAFTPAATFREGSTSFGLSAMMVLPQ